MFDYNNNVTEFNQNIVLDHVNPKPSSMEHDQEDIIINNSNSYDDLHNFPHPFLDDDDLFLTHFLSQQHQQEEEFNGDCWKEQGHGQEEEKQDETTRKTTTKKKKKLSSRSKNGIISSSSKSTKRSRGGKKDRHSKIYTAQGPRDRRMRLSLQIARKFFDLQDMLGFDKASKTIEWLLLNSNSAIKHLKQTYNNNNNNSGLSFSISGQSSEVVSADINNNQEQEEGNFKEKKSRALRTVGREARDRARARARQRTLFKNTLVPHSDDPPIISPPHHHHLSDFESIHTFFSGNINNNSYFDYPTFSCPNSSIFLPSPHYYSNLP